MAVAYLNAGTATHASVGSGSTPFGAGIAVGDGLLVVISAHGTNVVTMGQAGWTKLMEHATATTVITASWFWKIATATEVSAGTCTWTGTGTSRGLSAAYRFSGMDTVAMIRNSSSNPVTGASSVTHLANAASANIGDMLIYAAHELNGGGAPWTTIANHTKAHTSDLTSGGTTSSHNAYTMQYRALAVTSNSNLTATSTTAAVWGAYEIVVAAASTPTPAPVKPRYSNIAAMHGSTW